jgi:hypothetical protein
LFAGIVLSAAIIFSTIFYISNDAGNLVLGAFGVKDGTLEIDLIPMMPVGILAGVTIALQGYAIALFKNRKLQINIIRLSMLMTVLIIGFLGFVFYDLNSAGLTVIPFVGVFHAPLVLFADVLAIRGIKKDEALVKSVDRLR